MRGYFALTPEHMALGNESKAWPFQEARKIIKRYEKTGFPETITFETGYGPSGLPHLGTFGEVARTTMVRYAFHVLTNNAVKTQLLCFSDDMDGLRKVPDNIPNREMMARYLGKPLTQVPDPISNEHPSFGAGNNARLQAFLDRFGFEYSFASASAYYKAGRFDNALLKILSAYDKVMDIILPTLGEERRATYSPFLPISPISGKVLQVPMVERNVEAGTISYIEPETGDLIETSVTSGHVKCQWKVDWAMRWMALNIDYEMAGKDLIDSVTLSSKICRALGYLPPEGFNYELFLDEKGQKISKSKGNGLAIDEWLTYAPTESLSFYMYQKPKTAKRLYFDCIPKAVDDYYTHLAAYPRQELKDQLQNPIWHIHSGKPPAHDMPIPFSMLLNLVSASNAENQEVLWGFISRYNSDLQAEKYPELARLVEFSIRYYQDFVRPHKKFRTPTAEEKDVLNALNQALEALPPQSDASTIQNTLLEVGRTTPLYQDFNKKAPDGGPSVSLGFFKMLYQVLIGQEQGPRFGSFIELYGIEETCSLISKALSNQMSQGK